MSVGSHGDFWISAFAAARLAIGPMWSSEPKYRVTAILTASTSVQEFSKVFEGLHALHRSGQIHFSIRSSVKQSVPRVLRLEAVEGVAKERPIAIDIADDASILDGRLLEDVQIYFKRSYHADALSSLARPQARKVRPLGLNNPAIRPGTALGVLRARLRTGRDLRELAVDARQLFALPPPQAFEWSPEKQAEPLVLFQTRLWEPARHDPGRQWINEERADLIRTLRSAFGPRFLGGAIPTAFVRAQYPDLVTSLPFSMRAYPKLLKRPLVAIYSRGLLDSLAFKMSEYLAASRCIVGHAPASTLPEPLVADRNYLPFETAAECAAQCDRLLSRPAEAAEMRRSNWDYYQRQVEPSAHLFAILQQAFAS